MARQREPTGEKDFKIIIRKLTLVPEGIMVGSFESLSMLLITDIKRQRVTMKIQLEHLL